MRLDLPRSSQTHLSTPARDAVLGATVAPGQKMNMTLSTTSQQQRSKQTLHTCLSVCPPSRTIWVSLTKIYGVTIPTIHPRDTV